MKDLGDLHFFLNMEMERDHAQHLLYINQIGYLKEILKRFCMEDYKAIKMPLDLKTKLKKNVNKDGLVLAYLISMVSQHMAHPKLEHRIAVRHIFQYLQGTLQFKLHFRGLPP
jgi:hypothetical protein